MTLLAVKLVQLIVAHCRVKLLVPTSRAFFVYKRLSSYSSSQHCIKISADNFQHDYQDKHDTT
jgi:hypothetical protein